MMRLIIANTLKMEKCKSYWNGDHFMFYFLEVVIHEIHQMVCQSRTNARDGRNTRRNYKPVLPVFFDSLHDLPGHILASPFSV